MAEKEWVLVRLEIVTDLTLRGSRNFGITTVIDVSSASNVPIATALNRGLNECSLQRVATIVNTSDDVVMTMLAFKSA